MSWGKDYEFLTDLQAEGEYVPALESLPTLDHLQGAIVAAFWTVSGSRPPSFGSVPHPISIPTIAHWYDFGGFAAIGFEPLEFMDWIQFCDRVFLEDAAKRAKAKEKPQ